MVRNLKVTVDGRTYAVTVEDVAGAAETMYPSPGMSMAAYEPAVAEKPQPAPSAKPAPAAAPIAPGEGDIASPMTGVLLEYTVKAGDSVTVGQHVATIEAMKMKTVVVSPVAGKVTRLCAEPGSPVNSGEVLLSIG